MSELASDADAYTTSNDVTQLFYYDDVDDTSHSDGESSVTGSYHQTTLKFSKFLHVPDYPWVWLYVSPVILVSGILGNILTILIMRKRGMRGSTTCVYLSVLAFFDIFALITRIPPEFFKACNLFIFMEINRWTCKLEKFCFYAASDTAIWLLVAFSLDRLVAVSWPLLKKRLCRPKRALFVCFLVPLVFFAKNLHVFWTRDIEYDPNTQKIKKVCGRPHPYKNFEEYVRPWIAFATISILPFFLISISNAIIVAKLMKRGRITAPRKQVYKKAALSQIDQNSVDRLAYKRSKAQPDSKRGHRFTQTTLMCISASVCFLILVTPSIALILGRVYWTSRKSSLLPYGIAKAVNYQLSCFNHAVNFFLYCLTGERFRRELIQLFCGSRRGARPSKALTLSQRKFSDAVSSTAHPDDGSPPNVKPFIMREVRSSDITP